VEWPGAIPLHPAIFLTGLLLGLPMNAGARKAPRLHADASDERQLLDLAEASATGLYALVWA
jgi:hypothetical protein